MLHPTAERSPTDTLFFFIFVPFPFLFKNPVFGPNEIFEKEPSELSIPQLRQVV